MAKEGEKSIKIGAGYRLRILGTRGIPAAHGGFETFAEQLALFLTQKGWLVTVYCQEEGSGQVTEDEWNGIRRVRIPTSLPGPAGTIVFDWKSTLHAAREPGLILTLGYNTGAFCILYRLKGLANLINMDGIEWRRKKWGRAARLWFRINHWIACRTCSHFIADHPEIERHLAHWIADGNITMIPYGSEKIDSADVSALTRFQLKTNGYVTVIARPEPENSILEMVRAWSRKPRGLRLVVLGKYRSDNPYHRAVLEAASPEVIFPGAIYDKALLTALRFQAAFNMHGHQVGGTNPSLVEAMGAGNAILAHDNPYNRWVAGEGGLYFRNEDECAGFIDRLISDDSLLESLRGASRNRHGLLFTLDTILGQYEECLKPWALKGSG